MAKTFVSPGVFTSETDASFLAPGVGAIGGAIVGTTPKGPALVPISVQNYPAYVEMFGDLDEDHKATYAAKAYLRNAGVANIVRVLGPEGRTVDGTAVTPGYTAESLYAIVAISGTSNAYVMATLEVTGNADVIVNDLTGDEFDLRISSSAGQDTFTDVFVTASFLTGSENYVGKVLNTNPHKFSEKGYFLRDVHVHALKKITNGEATFISASYSGMTDFTFGFNSGSTPWIMSQQFGGSTEYNLFKVHTLGHGEAENGRFKISIRNVRVSPTPGVNDFGKFDLEVRSFSDNDKSRSVVETYPNLNLDSTSRNFIAKRIGDVHWEYDQSNEKMVQYGDFPNESSFIRIEMHTGSWPDAALPWGFRGLEKPDLMVLSGAGDADFGLESDVADAIVDVPYVTDLKDKETQSEAKDYVHWGIETKLSGAILARLAKYPTMTGSDADFSLRFVSGSTKATLEYNASNPVASQKKPGDDTDDTTLEPKYAKFTVPLAFGFDGWDKRVENPLDNDTQLTANNTIGVQAIRNAVDIVSDPDFIDINLLAIPGIYATDVVDYTITAIEDRADALYVMDLSGSTAAQAVTDIRTRSLDSSYAAVYYPNVKVRDTVNDKNIEVPASVPAIGAIAFNDRVSAPWFAPAGLNRGGLVPEVAGFTYTKAMDGLKASERDDLYENRINPIATFPGEGLVVWGQKTLQVAASALDRINVRRLLIKAKKLISSAAKLLVFEQNDPETRARFLQTVNPILQDIQQKRGLRAFKVVADETLNTPDVVDRNILRGKVLLVPTKSAEFIDINFVINNEGAVFEE